MTWNNQALDAAKSFDEVLKTTIDMLRRLRADGMSVHHIAGPITADGDDKINDNLVKLLEWRAELSAQLGSNAFVFTSPVIFSEDLYVRLGTFEKEPAAREAEFQKFWDDLIGSGMMDEIHFVPGWERSKGPSREHQTAAKHGIKIRYLGKAKTHDS